MSDAAFQTTRWTLVRAAGQGAERALGELCTIYRAPLLRHARRRGLSAADAEDAVQCFFARLLRLDSFAAARRDQGRFRAFLLGAFNHCLADLRDRERAEKRGGGRVGGLDTEAWSAVAADQAGPDAEFDRAWALTLLETTFARLRAEHVAIGRGEWFDTLAPCLPGRTSETTFAEVAARAGLGEPALRVAVHRLRKRYREVLRGEVARTVADPSEIDAELRHLLAAVSGA
jgi:DNA-directed RNA polymerase specialized sigma subunit, sigma24 homolog